MRWVISTGIFSLTASKTTITNGIFKGHQAIVLVPVPRDHFPFLDLPPEIRIMIYKMLLHLPYGQIIVRGKYARILHGHYRMTAVPGNKRPDTGILKACHQIHKEAASVLYGHNAFYFDNPLALKTFLTEIGTTKALLSRIEVGVGYAWNRSGRITPGLRQAVNLLSQTRNLRSLKLNLSSDLPKAKVFANHFEAVYRMLYEREGQDADKFFNLLELPMNEICGAHLGPACYIPYSQRQALHKSCPDCRAKNDVFVNTVKECIMSGLAKKKSGQHVRRENGRPQRLAVTKKKRSYAEIEELSTNTFDSD